MASSDSPGRLDSSRRTLTTFTLSLVALLLVVAPAALARRLERPRVSTVTATNVTATSATLTGTVNPNGLSTTYYFQYGTSTSYGSSTASASAGSGASGVSVQGAVAGLSAGRSYHFRLVASNSAGTSYGADATFTTVSSSPVPSPSWNGDFSTGDFSRYEYVDGNSDDFGLVRSPLPAQYPYSSFAFAATVDSGSGSWFAGKSGDRTLAALLPDHNTSQGMQGQDTWYRDEIYFPSSFQPTSNTSWNWLYELHNFPDTPCCANFALSVDTDSQDGGPSGGMRLSTRVMGGGSPAYPLDSGQQSCYANSACVVTWLRGPSLQYGHWYDLVWHVHWDWRSLAAGGQGLVEYFVDGTKVGTYTGPTLFYYAVNGAGVAGPGQAYMEEGFYRPQDSQAGYAQPTVQVLHAASMLGPTATSIGESLS